MERISWSGNWSQVLDQGFPPSVMLMPDSFVALVSFVSLVLVFNTLTTFRQGITVTVHSRSSRTIYSCPFDESAIEKAQRIFIGFQATERLLCRMHDNEAVSRRSKWI